MSVFSNETLILPRPKTITALSRYSIMFSADLNRKKFTVKKTKTNKQAKPSFHILTKSKTYNPMLNPLLTLPTYKMYKNAIKMQVKIKIIKSQDRFVRNDKN